ncbi:hypothetical protein ABH932_005983 [Streptacidiphilus sp. MAP5-52]
MSARELPGHGHDAVSPRPAYPETLVPFTWPTPGVRTWQSSNGGTYVFPGCTGVSDCACSCGVGVYKVNGRVYGCDCPGHDARRARLAAR